MKMTWFFYAILAAVSFSAMLLMFKKLGDLGIKDSTILLYVFGIGMLFYLSHSLIAGNSLKVDWKILALLAGAALFSYLGNLLHIKALISAPNPGYADAVSSLRIVLIAIAAIFLFHSQLTLIKATGIVMAVAGFILLGL